MSTRDLNFKELVERAWGKELTKPDIAYEFTGRKFEESRRSLAAVESVVVGDASVYADNYADNYS